MRHHNRTVLQSVPCRICRTPTGGCDCQYPIQIARAIMFLFSGAHVRGMPVEVAVVVNVELSQRQERRDGLIEAHPAGLREVYTWLYARSTQRWLACLQVSRRHSCTLTAGSSCRGSFWWPLAEYNVLSQHRGDKTLTCESNCL